MRRRRYNTRSSTDSALSLFERAGTDCRPGQRPLPAHLTAHRQRDQRPAGAWWDEMGSHSGGSSGPVAHLVTPTVLMHGDRQGVRCPLARATRSGSQCPKSLGAHPRDMTNARGSVGQSQANGPTRGISLVCGMGCGTWSHVHLMIRPCTSVPKASRMRRVKGPSRALTSSHAGKTACRPVTGGPPQPGTSRRQSDLPRPPSPPLRRPFPRSPKGPESGAGKLVPQPQTEGPVRPAARRSQRQLQKPALVTVDAGTRGARSAVDKVMQPATPGPRLRLGPFGFRALAHFRPRSFACG